LIQLKSEGKVSFQKRKAFLSLASGTQVFRMSAGQAPRRLGRDADEEWREGIFRRRSRRSTQIKESKSFFLSAQIRQISG
jgi:hypothetical protein